MMRGAMRMVGLVGLLGSVQSLGCGDDGQGGGTDGTDGTSSGTQTASATQPTAATDDPSGSPSSGPTSASTSESSTSDDPSATATATSTTSATTGSATTTGDTTGSASACDFETVNGFVVIEAESLPIIEDWSIATEEAGYWGDGYIVWTGTSHNNDPTHGVMNVTIHIDTPGRYRLAWRNRIGMGTNTTEHNDSWVKFPDAADYYGLQLDGGDERRRYPSPKCDDAGFVAEIEALPQVIEVECVEGSSVEDWFKVYSSGASDWSWSTRTNDNNAFDVMVEFDTAGDYTFSTAARGDWHLVDRIVIHEESLEDAVWQDETAAETACR